MAPRLIDLRRDAGWVDDTRPTIDMLGIYRQTGAAEDTGSGLRRRRFLDRGVSAFARRFQPCRSGCAKRSIRPDMGSPDAEIVANILRDNIYGVDLSPADVDMTKLMLWLHGQIHCRCLKWAAVLSGNSFRATRSSS